MIWTELPGRTGRARAARRRGGERRAGRRSGCPCRHPGLAVHPRAWALDTRPPLAVFAPRARPARSGGGFTYGLPGRGPARAPGCNAAVVRLAGLLFVPRRGRGGAAPTGLRRRRRPALSGRERRLAAPADP